MDVAIGGFDPSEVSVKEGDVSIRFTNLDAFGHDFTIEELGLKVLLGPNETRTVTFTGSPGTYTFICSVPGHEEAGMVGTLTVLPAAGH
ncbi:MAG: cupredoxin domain-containing protein [Actinobacteria bacterium]|nr:cupredoxin domain-containing protein [Actinomycetota bacterium]